MISLILRTTTRYLLPLLLLFSIFLLVRGHHHPGGGFIGGLMAAAAVSLCAIAFDVDEARKVLHFGPQVFFAGGLLIAGFSGLAGLAVNQPLLTGLWFEIPFPGLGSVELGTPLLFDFGVYLVVIGVTTMILFTLAEE